MRAFLIALLAVILATPSASAHLSSDSYLRIDVADQGITGQWDIALRDLDVAVGIDANGDGDITWGEVRAKRREIEAYAFSHLTVSGGGGDCAAGTFRIANTVTLANNQTQTVALCVAAAPLFSVDKSVDDAEVGPGDTVTYTIVVTNDGKADGTTGFEDDFDDRLTPTVPAGCSLGTGPEAGTLQCSTGTIAAGDTQTFTYTAAMPEIEVNKTVGGSVPKQYVPAVEHGVQEALHQGVLSHNEVVDVRVSLTDGKEHPVDSSEMAFKLAGSQALKEGVEKAHPVLLEPIVNVRVKAPETFTGDLVSDLNGKRAHVLGITPEDHGTVIDAQAPLAEMQRYATDLRSLTQGRATSSLHFSHYAPVPTAVQEEVVAKVKGTSH